MSELPENLHYAETHEWAMVEEGGIVRVGITDFAQQQLGDLVFVDLPELDSKVFAGGQCAVVESVKTASDLHSPVTGEIVAVNDKLQDSPELINDAPYETWIFAVKTTSLGELAALMDAASYAKNID